MTPLEILSGAFSIANGAIVLGQFVLRLADVDQDTRACILLLERVNRDISAAEELQRLIYPMQRLACRQQQRAVEVIRDTQSASRDLRFLVSLPRHSRVPLGRRFKWVMGDKELFLNREKRLNYCHQALIQVIATMEHLVASDLISMPPAYSAIAYTDNDRKSSQNGDLNCSIRSNPLQKKLDLGTDAQRNSLDKWLSPSQKWVYLYSEGMGKLI